MRASASERDSSAGNLRESPDLAAPRPWTVLVLGAFHEHVILIVILSAAVPCVAAWAAGPDVLPGWAELGLAGLGLAMISGFGQHLVAAPLARLLKRHWTRTFRVLYFRSFDPGASNEARDSLSPILGGMGTLTAVHDREFIQGLSQPDGHAEQEDLWLAWLEIGEILSDALAAPRFTDGEWRSEVPIKTHGAIEYELSRGGRWRLRRELYRRMQRIVTRM